jgi:hypothetical protein
MPTTGLPALISHGGRRSNAIAIGCYRYPGTGQEGPFGEPVEESVIRITEIR